MSYSFEEIMKYHPDNEDVYNEIKDNLSCMVPFVGAGLTCFVYNTWPNVLKNLSEKVTNSKNKKTINLLIRNGELEKAAQCLEEFRGPANLARDIANYFSPDKFDKKCHELKEEAIYLFPLVFSDLVLTTNFDSGLEITYQTWERKFQNILHPGHSELLRQLLRNTAGNNLFKFHGNVNGKNIEYDSLVFTLKQYDQHYREDSDLVKELKNCLEKKVMFFLGCSLKEDRTMEVLENIIQKGDYHYTIIGCKKSERDDKVLYLEKKHIRAILYEDNRHEAVKVILEQLLKETKPEAYKELLRYTKKREPSNYFECNEIQVSFYGRKNEINELNVFLSDRDICFRWWAITGPGGSGKSRLAYEFQKQLPEDWDVYRLAHTDYRQLSEISTSFVRKTLIIADYVEEHAQELGVWMEQLAQSMHRFPLRFLLIGRKTGDVSAGFDWNNQQLNIFLSIKNKNRNIQGTELSLAPEKLQDDVNASPSSLLLAGKTDAGFSWERQFYNGIYDRQLIRKTCFRLDYLELKPLSDKALRSIIRDYAVAIRKDNKTGRAMPDRQIEAKLLDKLKAIDPVLCRPLYAMFLTSAYMNGNEPERWGREDVLDYMIERELSRLEFGIRDITGLKTTDRKLFAACQYLQCISTTLQGVSVGKMQEICPDIWEVIEKKSEYFESSIDLLYQLGLIDRDRMPALRPDLIGEYFVFTWLGKQREETINRFLTAVWKIPRPTVVFFSRIFNDYGFLLDESAEKWEMLFLKDLPQSVDSAILYSMFLMNITGNCNIQKPCEKCVQQLKALINIYPDVPEIMIVYANSMINLIIRQETVNAKGTAKVLEEFASSHSNIPELTIALARGLINLGEKKDSSIIPRIANRLERLVEEHPNMPEVANCFAESLIQLGNTMTGQEALNNIQKLESLAEKYPDSSEIIIRFSEGVYNLTVNQDRCFIEPQVKRLEELAADHPDIPSVVIMLSKGLFNLSVKLEGEEERTVIKRLETLAASYSCVPEVATEFAKSLVNLSSKQTLHEKRNTLKQLDRLAAAYPDISEIVIAFSHGLVNLSNVESAAEAQKGVRQLKALVARYPRIEEVVTAYANSLFNLSRHQGVEEVRKTLIQIEKLSSDYSDISNVVIAYAKTLHMAGYKLCHQNSSEVYKITEKLKGLMVAYSNIPQLIVEYANFLLTLSSETNDRKRVQKIVNELETLESLYPKNSEIKVIRAKGLINLCVKNDKYETVKQLKELSDVYPANSDIITAYAISLYNLVLIQNSEEAEETVNQLENLANAHLAIPKVVTHFAFGLMALSEKQNKTSARKNVERLKKLYACYPETTNIKSAFNNFFSQLEDIIEMRPQSL